MSGDLDRLEAEYLAAKRELSAAVARVKTIKDALLPLRAAYTEAAKDNELASQADVLRAFVGGAKKAECAAMLGRKSGSVIETLIDQFLHKFVGSPRWNDPEFEWRHGDTRPQHDRRIAGIVLQRYEASL